MIKPLYCVIKSSFSNSGNIENAYHPTTSHLVSNSETLNEHENNPTNVSSFHSLETTSREKENPSNFFGGSGLMQGAYIYIFLSHTYIIIYNML